MHHDFDVASASRRLSCGRIVRADVARRRYESEQGLQLKQKLLLALTAYAALGFVAWQTLSNEPIGIGGIHASLRTLTLVILGIFAFRTLMGYWRLRIEEDDARPKQ